jgi:hypothetical protein
VGASGISTGFPVLSRSSGQVAHVLLTRSPLDLHRYCYRMDLVRLACVRHAASVRPEPGSNSPLRPRPDPEARPKSKSRPIGSESTRPTRNWHRTDIVRSVQIDWRPRKFRGRPHWLLAITIPFSRSDRAHAGGVGAGCPQIGAIAPLRRCPMTPKRPLIRACHTNPSPTGCQSTPGEGTGLSQAYPLSTVCPFGPVTQTSVI